MHFSGGMSPDDVLHANLAFCEDYRSDEASYQILDTLAVTGLTEAAQAYADTMETLAAMDAGSAVSLDVVMVAMVSTSREVIELFESCAGINSDMETAWSRGVFTDLDSARAWISAGCSRPA